MSSIPKTRSLLLLLISLSLASGCGLSPGATVDPAGEETIAPPATDAGLPTSVPLRLQISFGELSPPFSPETQEYELITFTSRAPPTLTVHGASATVGNIQLLDGQPANIELGVLRADRTLDIDIQVPSGGSKRYRIRLLPKDFPTYSVQVRPSAITEGELFLAPFAWNSPLTPYLLVVGPMGEPRYYQRLESAGLDFKPHVLANGQVRYTYVSANKVLILDASMRELRSEQIRATTRHPSWVPDVHEVLMLGENHLLLMAYIDRTVTNVPVELPHPSTGARVQAAVVQELVDGEVVFEWDSTEHPELYSLSTEGNDFSNPAVAADYAHINSAEVDPRDGNLVMSFRHLDCILKVSRETGKIVWRLGGPNDTFGTTEDQRPSHQHDARVLPDGRLQLYDNGNARGASRVLRYSLDEANRQLLVFESIALPYFSRAMGSARLLRDGGTLIGLGAHLPNEPDAVELDSSGKQRFALTFDAAYYSYRAFKLEPVPMN